jgi:3-oxoadipate enol-lactonase
MSVLVHHQLDGPEDAPPVVLSTSIGTSLSMWDPQVPALAERFRVVRYDHRGHGRSPVPEGPYTIADLGGDVVALLDRLDIERAHFCGLSLGGMVGMWLGIHAPERIDRLVLCCTTARFPADPWHERAATVREHGTDAVASAVVERWFTPQLRAEDPELVARSEALIGSIPDEGYAGACEAIATMQVADDLGRITAPTLVIAGAEDPATPPETAARIAEQIGDARVEVVGGAAHLANVEQPEAVTRLIIEHLTGGAA